MTLLSCLLCGLPMTQYQPGVATSATQASDEHIIPAGIGGRWRRADLICKACNDRLGSHVDIHLVEWARPLTSFLMIRHGRTGVRPAAEFKVDGIKYRFDPQTGRTTVLGVSVNKDALEVSGPLGLASEAHLREALRGLARGRDPATLGEMILRYEDEPAPQMPLEVDWQFREPGVQRAVAKIAYLGTAALLGRKTFAHLNAEPLRLAMLGEVAPELVIAPLGARGLRRMGHGVSLHRLPDGRLGALVILFGVLQVLVPVGEVMRPLPEVLPAVVVLPLSRDEAVHPVESPELSLTFDSHPEVMPGFLKQELEEHLLEVQEQGMIHRAWNKSNLPEETFAPQRLQDLTPEQRHTFLQALAVERDELDAMRRRDQEER